VENSCFAGSLFELLAQIPDPRGRRGRRHPMVAMLTAIVCAILTGAHGYRAIAHWVRSQNVAVWQWLGFHRNPPCANSFRNLLMALNPDVLEAVLRQWMVQIVEAPPPNTVQAVAMDGKTLCNTLSAHERNVQLLSLLDQATGGVLSQQAVPPTTNEAKTAADLLKTIVLKGRLVTGDAMFCQRELCEEIVDSGGDYLFVVKDNQPELKAAVAADFQPGFSPRHRKPATSIAV
jgi:DDE_Tnp_1-associated/Transposase DDE domain